MKQLLTSLFLLFFSANLFAQDVIVRKDGSTILSKVIEVGISEIKYKKYSNLNGPIITIPKSAVIAVNYENGERDSFINLEEALKKKKFQNNLRWAGGGLLTALGLYCIADELFIGVIDVDDTGSWVLFGSSLASIGGGVWLLCSAIKHQKRINKMEMQIQGVSLYEYNMNFTNGSSLGISADILNDIGVGTKTMGLGIRYYF